MSSLAVLLHAAIALGVVLALVWGGAHLLRRRSGGRAVGGVVVVSRVALGKGVALAVVRHGRRELLVGVSPGGVSLLGEISGDADVGVEDDATPVSSPAPARGLLPLPGGLGPLGGDGRRAGLSFATGRQGVASGVSGRPSPAPWTALLATLRERTVRRPS